jgi:two-component system sensor histidine kinase KdpD
MMSSRPDPDALLVQAKSEEQARGRLKIFMGYAAGVGKTYAMLEAAHQRVQEGVDAVVGYVETHGRLETEALLEGLEVVPRRSVEYRGVRLEEMDVDAVLARHPALVLIDELAHTNAPGSRHPKRFIDVEEILDAGVDVYTTFNIQHLESLNDVVAQVTGVYVHETVPDSVIDEASEIEVVDLPPDELLTRLREGRVYIPDQAARAIELFFRKGNLTALREMSLRRAAERVDGQMRAYMQTRGIPGPWPAGERLLVCISPNPLAERLVRTTRRLADQLNAEWYAVYVELASKPELDPANRERIGRTLQLAEELGAKSTTLAGRSMPEAVLAFARKNNVTKVVVGKPFRPRWREWLTGSVVDQLIYAGGDVDVYVISASAEPSEAAGPPPWRRPWPLKNYLAASALVAVATVIGHLVRGRLEPVNLVMLYLAVVVTAAVYLGRGPAFLAAVAGVLAFDFFLVPPYLTFAVSDTEYLLTFIGLFLVSLVVSTLTARVRHQAEAAVRREAQTSELYSLGRDLTSATDLKQVAEIIVAHISQVFGREVAIFIPEGGHLQTFVSSPDYHPGANELAVAEWAYEHDQPAGRGTNTLPAAALRCQPLKTARGLVGVLGIKPADPASMLTPEQRTALIAFADQAALAVERARLAQEARQAELLRAEEQLQTSLLNSISHDLRTPLVAITGALSALDEDTGVLDPDARRALIENARAEADRLNSLVGNLLDMTRIEAGVLKLSLEASDISDLVSTSIEAVRNRLDGRMVRTNIDSDLPLVDIDFVLFVQVMVNLLDNAAKYSPIDQPIEITAGCDDNRIVITVDDRGPGIPEEDRLRVFDKFYRVQRPGSIHGTGLGLSICKGIVEAHGGEIRAEERPGGGTRIRLTIPTA